MSNNAPEPRSTGGAQKPPEQSGKLPDWIVKPFDGMALGRPIRLAPYVPPRSGLFTFERLRLLGICLVLGSLLTTFLVLGSQPFAILNPDPPGLNNDIVTPVPPNAFQPSARSTALLQELSLDANALKSWTKQDWALLYFSRSPDILTLNSYLYTSVEALKPLGFASQDFVNLGASCTALCQFSWAGITFMDRASTFKAFDLIDQETKSSGSGYSKLNFFNTGPAAAYSCVSKQYAGERTGWVTCLFMWDNLVTSMRVISQDTGNQDFASFSLRLIGQITDTWQARLASKPNN